MGAMTTFRSTTSNHRQYYVQNREINDCQGEEQLTDRFLAAAAVATTTTALMLLTMTMTILTMVRTTVRHLVFMPISIKFLLSSTDIASAKTGNVAGGAADGFIHRVR